MKIILVHLWRSSMLRRSQWSVCLTALEKRRKSNLRSLLKAQAGRLSCLTQLNCVHVFHTNQSTLYSFKGQQAGEMLHF